MRYTHVKPASDCQPDIMVNLPALSQRLAGLCKQRLQLMADTGERTSQRFR
ncbi:hypothetical protein QDT22_003785 [Salmonella enterica]|nr:hypothetical protein [Salmonella enterica]